MADPKLITDEFQVTAPQEVRKDEQVTIKKATRLDRAYLKALESTVQEWASKNDEEGYFDL
jgi:hypothetical protein